MPARISPRIPSTTTPPAGPAPVSPATIREAEKLLKLAGFNPGPVDGRTSPAFERAVREFQGAWGLSPSGQVDAATLKKLRTTGQRIQAWKDDGFVGVGQKSSAIRGLEQRLNLLGYDAGKADGLFTRQTADAVKAFKADQKSIHNTAGVLGLHARKVLRHEVNALAHAPERRRLSPTKAQTRLDAATAKAVAKRHADGTIGLREGSRGGAVTNVQKHLAAAGFSPKRTDGHFDERTAGALSAFQRRSGLPASGVADAQTWRALKKSFILSDKAAGPAQAVGERSGAVRATEKLLKRVGLNPGAVDGLFDRRTQRAVKAFERKHGLPQDGKVSGKDLAKLKKVASTTGGIHVTAAMRRLAGVAQRTGLAMGGYTGLGLCATGVSRSIRAALGISVWGNGNQIDNNLPRSRFRQVNLTLAQALKIPGLVLTWERTSSTLGQKYGHTAITMGNGLSSASDFLERNTLGAAGRSGLKVFVPIR